MRILHVIPSLSPLRGGPSAVLHATVRELVALGFDVDVVSTDDDGAGRRDVASGVPVVENGAVITYFQRQIRFYTVSLPLLRWLAKRAAGYDVVHIHSLFSFPSTAAAFCCLRNRVPYILRPLGVLNRWGRENRRPRLKRISLRWIERPLLERAAAVHFTSEQERQEAMEVVPRLRGVVIPNPVAPATDQPGEPWLRKEYPGLQGRRIVLFLARLDEKKGLDLLLDAFASARRRQSEIALVLAGNTPAKSLAILRARAAALGIDDSVVWTGFLDEAGKFAAIREADLFVLPSYSENFGVSVVEAMGGGLPVIVSNRVGIHAEIAEAGAGLVVGCNAEELAERIIQILNDPDARTRMGARGRELAERFTPAKVVGQIADLYRQIRKEQNATA